MARRLPSQDDLDRRVRALSQQGFDAVASELARSPRDWSNDTIVASRSKYQIQYSREGAPHLGVALNNGLGHALSLALELADDRDLDEATRFAAELMLGSSQQTAAYLDLLDEVIAHASAVESDPVVRRTQGVGRTLVLDFERALHTDFDLEADFERLTNNARLRGFNGHSSSLWGALRMQLWWDQVVLAWALTEPDDAPNLGRLEPIDPNRALELPQALEALLHQAQNDYQNGAWDSNEELEEAVKSWIDYLVRYQRSPSIGIAAQQRVAEQMSASLGVEVLKVNAAQIGLEVPGLDNLLEAGRALSETDGTDQDNHRAEQATEQIEEAQRQLLATLKENQIAVPLDLSSPTLVRDALGYTDDDLLLDATENEPGGGESEFINQAAEKDGKTLGTAIGALGGAAVGAVTGATTTGGSALAILEGTADGVIAGGAAGGALGLAIGAVVGVFEAILRRYRAKKS